MNEEQILENADSVSLGNIRDYIAIARPDHWIKHLFILPGIVLALLLLKKHALFFPYSLFLGFPSAFMIASANYVINEWCDAVSDRFHPNKKNRPAAAGRISAKFVYLEYFLLATFGLALARFVSFSFFIGSILFLLMGFLYNVKPFRFKDRAFLDVLVESVNNPIRLMLGWNMVSSDTIAPLSLLVAYWFGGAFLMATKRLAEFRFIEGQNKLVDLKNYRKSFRIYTENSLLVSSFLYGLLSSFFVAAFLIKYRNEYLFSFPVFAMLFAYYLSIALTNGSVAQNPEKSHKDFKLLLLVGITIGVFTILTFINIPLAQKLVGVHQNINYWPW